MDIAAQVLSLLGFLIRALGFALLGFGRWALHQGMSYSVVNAF